MNPNYKDPDIEIYTNMIEAKELLLKNETDPEKIQKMQQSILFWKYRLEDKQKEAEHRKKLYELAKARVGKVVPLGTFEVTSNKLIITDPCYEKGTWCQGTLDNPMPGKWYAYIQYRDEGSWGIRNSTLVAVHESCRLQDAVISGYLYNNHLANYLDADIGVDSGQAGIFDEAKYPQDPSATRDREEDENGNRNYSGFYDRCGIQTIGDGKTELYNEGPYREDALGAGVVTEGCVSMSGDGDGSYRCFFNKNGEGKVDAVEISFYWHDSEDTEEFDEYEEESEDSEENEDV